MIYKFNEKKSDKIIKHSLEFYSNNNLAKEFCSDNGQEFKNLKLDDICKKEGIIFIYEIPYNPHSHGNFKKFHCTIKNYF